MKWNLNGLSVLKSIINVLNRFWNCSFFRSEVLNIVENDIIGIYNIIIAADQAIRLLIMLTFPDHEII